MNLPEASTPSKAPSFWRTEDPILDAKGLVSKGGMFEHQRKWWNSPKFMKALVTGYGGGKTLIGSKWSISMALTNASHVDIVPHACVSPSFKIARKTIIPTITSLLDGKKTIRKDLSYRYNKSEHEFLIRCGGRRAIIWISSGDNPDSLKGPNLGSALIDEPFIQDREVLDQMIARVRHPLAKIKHIGLTGTPEELNWGYDICEGEDKDKYDVDLIQASTLANKAIDRSYYDRIKKAFTEKAALAYLEGQFVSLSEGQVYYAFDPLPGGNIQDLPDPGGELEIGMDFNVNPMAANVFWRVGDKVHIIDEIELPNSDTEEMCSHIKKLYPGRVIRNVYPDASGRARHSSAPGGKSDFNYIEAAGFKYWCHTTNPPRRDRYNITNGKLKNKTLTISPKCKKLKHYFMEYSYEKMLKQQAMSHLLDASTYPIAYLFPVSRIVQVKKLSGF